MLARLNRLSFVAPLIISGVACAIVLANIVAGVAPQPDEDASAHIWQLLMAIQLPIIALFVTTGDWRRGSTVLMLLAQIAAFAGACILVWLAGY